MAILPTEGKGITALATKWWFSSGICGGPPVLLALCPDLDDPDDSDEEPLEERRDPSLSRRARRSSRERRCPSISGIILLSRRITFLDSSSFCSCRAWFPWISSIIMSY